VDSKAEIVLAFVVDASDPSTEIHVPTPLEQGLHKAGFEHITTWFFAADRLASVGSGAEAVVVCLDKVPLSEQETAALKSLDRPFLLALLSNDAVVPPELASHPTFDFRAGIDDVEIDRLARAVRPEPIVLHLSASVASVRGRLRGDVSVAALAREFAAVHPDYLGARAGTLEFTEQPSAKRQTVHAWLEETRRLYAPEIRTLSTRRVLFGLGLLEPSFREALERQDHAFATLTRELDPPPELALSGEGQRLWRAEISTEGTEQSVPIHTDNPATVDTLQREGLARVLAKRIRDMRSLEESTAQRLKDEDFPRGRSFLVHLDGPWGAGKTSLLNFLTRELEPGERIPLMPFFGRRPAAGEAHWIVVQFNAWQHQRIVPPWWWLMSSLSRQGGRGLWRIDVPRAVLFRVREWIWRAWIGWPWYLLAAAAGGVIAVLAVTGHLHSPKHPGGWIAAGGASISAVLALWGVLRGLARSMVTSSTRGAREYIRHASDPMQSAKEHFARLVNWLAYPIVISVDDLDRCRDKYVVELLEGIQTLFRDVPVVYVVAADRDWLADSYANEYRSFKSRADEPGRPFGYLFLEKTFQISARVPTMSPEILIQFWGRLIRTDRLPDQDEMQKARVEADREFEGLETEEEIRQAIVSNPGASAAEQQARAEAAAMKLAAPEHRAATEHSLLPFAALVDSNPRSLKQLVNAFGIARDIETLYGRNLKGDVVKQHQTALWTLLRLRWPKLADYLAEHPSDVTKIGVRDADGVPSGLKPLFSDARVVRVVTGQAKDVRAKLDEEAIREVLGFEQSPEPAVPVS
jgi:KAP family P-loop domain